MAVMDQRLDIITARVDDVDTATGFYTTSLGWEPIMHVDGQVAFIQIAPGTVLGLFDAEGFDADIGVPVDRSFTLAHNVDCQEDVATVVGEMAEAGGTVLKEPQRAEFGGYHAYVSDRAGIVWEIAHNPGWSVDNDGTVTLEPVEG